MTSKTTKIESRVVEATGIAGSTRGRNNPVTGLLGDAMRKALMKAQAEGITDPEVLRGTMLDARQKIKDSIK